MIGDFHFLRPWLLLALLPLGLLVWALLRRGDPRLRWRGIIAPHLLPHLLRGAPGRARVAAAPLLWLGIGWLLGVLALAGPSWRRAPSPFADDVAAMVLIVRVTPSMMTEDLPPSRLARAVLKVQDLLKKREGAKAALIAYAGSAHVVMPLTTDASIIQTFAAALDSKIMPVDGDAFAEALHLADKQLSREGGGSICWITDGMTTELTADILKWRQQSLTRVQVLPMVPPGAELNTVLSMADTLDAKVVRLSADDTDVTALARAAKYVPVVSSDAAEQWQDAGYWLLPWLAGIVLLFFRRGWVITTSETA